VWRVGTRRDKLKAAGMKRALIVLTRKV